MPSIHRLPKFPLILSLLTITAVAYVRGMPEFERNFKGWLTAAIPLLALILLLIWFLCTRRYAWRTKLLGLVSLLALGFGLKMAVRVDGTVDGTGLPNYVWKWSPKSRPEIALVKPTADPVSLSADPRLSQAADVPQFFGNRRDGQVQAARLARDWTTTAPKELWRQPIGAGWSAFAVVQGRAYTQEQRGEEELVTCYHLLTGKVLWAHADKASFSQWQGGDGPRATPTVDEGRVFTYGATGLLNCLEAGTGQPIWQRSVLTENKLTNIEWGVSASPLLVDDKVIVTGGNPKGHVLFAYHRDTGAPLWQAGDDQASYASPLLADIAGRKVILSSNAHNLTAHDPATGSLLLNYPWGDDKWPKASQPVVIGSDRIFLSAGYGVGCIMLEIKAQSDGRLSATELWRSMKMKTQFNSPALHDGHLYGLDDGRLACLEISSGERLWKEGRFASGQSLLAGDLIIIQNENGTVHLCAANPASFQELGSIKALSNKTWNHPVLAGRYLLVRNDREAACYELPGGN